MTDFKLGAPCWLELNTPDVGSAAEFYRWVFGWTLHELGFDAGGYRSLCKGDRLAAAVGPLEHEEQRPAWTVIFAADDVDRVVDEAESRGGSIYVEPFSIPPIGRMAILMDSQGGVFGVWQGERFAGFEVFNEPDSFRWAELWTPDAGKSRYFYSGLFGWEYTFVEEGEYAGYAGVRGAGTSEGEEHGGVRPVDRGQLPDGEGVPVWQSVFMVADCDVSARLVHDGGGKVYRGPEDGPNVGRTAICADPLGAEFVLLAPFSTV